MYYKLCMLLIAAQACIGLEQPCECPEDFSPVCGSDGNTYGNVCLLECADSKYNGELDIVVESACEVPDLVPPCPCPLINAPVCGSNGVTYANKCGFECAKTIFPLLELKHRGSCDNEYIYERP